MDQPGDAAVQAGGQLTSRVESALRSGLIRPEDIGFEVTESSLLEDVDGAVEVLSTLRALGVQVALDDFGTGYSSLSYLRQLPVTAVKIDRQFITGIGDSLTDEAIIEAVIDLAHALDLRVIAEGIEELSQLEALIRMSADEAQGYYFSQPAPIDEIERLIGQHWPIGGQGEHDAALISCRASARPVRGCCSLRSIPPATRSW